MNPTALLNSLGSIGFFSSRIFLPALMTALLIRFGADIPLLQHTDLVHHISRHPAWFTSDTSITVLAALSILEFLATKNPDARRLMLEFDSTLKAGMALLTSLGMLSATDADFVRQTAHQAGFTTYFPALLAAAGAFSVGRVRGAALAALHEIDAEDSLHLQHMISWAEDAWIVFGMLLLVFYPIIMLLIIGVAIGMLILFRKYLEAIEEHARIPCAHCGTSIYPCATVCPHCRTPVAVPHDVGMLGQSKPYPSPDPANQRYRLIEKKRCPVCATHLKGRSPHLTCGTCGYQLMHDEQSTQQYLDYVGRRLPTVLGISTLWSLVPIIGLVVGTIYFRIKLVNPFSVYLPFGKRFLLRWGIRLLFLILFVFQLAPVAGAVVVPLMALISYFAYRSIFQASALAPEPLRAEFSGQGSAIPAQP